MSNIITAGNATNNGTSISSDTSGVLELKTGSTPTTAIAVDASQNVGIGTSSPAYKLDVSGVIRGTGNIYAGDGAAFIFGTGATSYLSGSSTSNVLTFLTASTERMRIDSSGKVGIGTTSPTGILNVKGTGGDALPATSGSTQSAGLVTRLQQGGGIGSVMDIGGNGGTGSWIQVTEPSNLATNYPLLLNPNGGSVLVGTTSVINGSNAIGQFLNVNGGRPGIAIGNSVGSSPTNAIIFINSNGTVGSIQTSASATSYVTSSDYRLKNTIAPMTGALAKVALLKPVTYKWNADGSDGQGFIAHELQAVVPQCVSGEKDAVNEDGSIKPQGIDTSFLVATLTAAIQELKAELDATKAEVAALKGA